MLKLKTRPNSGSDTLTRNPSRLGQNRWPCSISALSYYMTVAISIIVHHFQWKNHIFEEGHSTFPTPYIQWIPDITPVPPALLRHPASTTSMFKYSTSLLAISKYCHDFDLAVRLVWTAKTSQSCTTKTMEAKFSAEKGCWSKCAWKSVSFVASICGSLLQEITRCIFVS